MGSIQEIPLDLNQFHCPCFEGSQQVTKVSSFVGDDYFCESSAPGMFDLNIFYTSDPLWDGQQCNSEEATC